MDKDKIIQNLKDAGCNSSIIDEFFRLYKTENNILQIKLLSKYKKELLNELHSSQKKIDYLDFLIYKLKENENYKKEQI